MLVVTEALEHPEHRFRDAQDLGRRQEVVQHPGVGDHDGGAAAGGDAETAPAVGPELRAEAEIVDADHHVIGRAAFERDLEFARQRRAQRMPEQKTRQSLRVRRHVEALVGRHARVRAAGDVSHRVAARLARRQTGFGEAAHRRLDIVQLDEVELNVLPRRDVPEAARVPLRHVGECIELVGRQHALWNLDAQHLRIFGLPLSVGAAHQPERAPLLGRQLTALVLLERGHELVDVRNAGEREPRAAERFWIVYY